MANPSPKPAGAAPAPAAASSGSEKAVKSYGATVQGEKGRSMRFLALKRRDGSAVSYGMLYDGTKGADGKRKGKRGATSTHTSFDEAKTAVDNALKAALKAGWIQKRGGGGYRAAKDTFDIKSLPSPTGK